MLTALGEHSKIMMLDSIGHISHAEFASIYTVRQVLDFVRLRCLSIVCAKLSGVC